MRQVGKSMPAFSKLKPPGNDPKFQFGDAFLPVKLSPLQILIVPTDCWSVFRNMRHMAVLVLASLVEVMGELFGVKSYKFLTLSIWSTVTILLVDSLLRW